MNGEKAIEILRATNDGNDLAPEHLKLTELAVNGFLSETGVIAFERLYADVSAGKYTKPWYHGIEHLRKDHQGYVYWKDIQVEHYSFKDHDEAHTAALELAERCRTLERLGITVSCRNVIWSYHELVS